jgi:hypothetical protein
MEEEWCRVLKKNGCLITSAIYFCVGCLVIDLNSTPGTTQNESGEEAIGDYTQQVECV